MCFCIFAASRPDWIVGDYRRAPRSIPQSLRGLSGRNHMQISLPESSRRAPEDLPELSRKTVSQSLPETNMMRETFGRLLRETLGDLLGDLREISPSSQWKTLRELFGRPNLYVISPGALPELSRSSLRDSFRRQAIFCYGFNQSQTHCTRTRYKSQNTNRQMILRSQTTPKTSKSSWLIK